MRSDPFSGYTLLVRVIVFGLVPVFTLLQVVRLRRALHIFQLEGYKRGRFIHWCRNHRRRALFLRAQEAKKPLVMTGRAWRILVVAAALVPLLALGPAGLAHVWLGGFPADVVTWVVATVALFVFTPHLLVAADTLLSPVQAAINNRYLDAARHKLDDVAPLVIGITGSYGKTSTKFAVERLVGPPGCVLATPGSFNTPLGVCRTINEGLDDDHRYFVVEMGAYGEGEIADLCRFVGPKVGVLTALGPVHLERFGSMDAIRRGKYELVRALPDDGTAVMNVDDPEVRALADRTDHVRVIRFGLEPGGAPHVTAQDVETSPSGTEFTIVDRRDGTRIDATTRLLGRHAVVNVLAGVAVARIAGREPDEIGAAIATLEPVEHRLQLIEGTGGVIVIDDAYNSNPAGAAAALEVLARMPGKRKVVVTPGIVELGPLQEEENRLFGSRAAEIADVVVFVATLNRDALVAGALSTGHADIVFVDSLAQATERLQTILGPGDVVLFENDLPDQYEQ